MTINCPHCNEPNEIQYHHGFIYDGAKYECECGYNVWQDEFNYDVCLDIVKRKIEQERQRAYNGIEPGEDNS